MKRKNIVMMLLAIGVAGCQHDAGTLGQCYDGMFTSFCVVNVPKDMAVVTGVGMVPGMGAMANGVGSVMLGQGAILNGVGAIVR